MKTLILILTLISTSCASFQQPVEKAVAPDGFGVLVGTDKRAEYTGTTFMLNWDLE